MINKFGILLSVLLLLMAKGAISAPLYFEYTAHIDSSDRPGAPEGTLLTGRFSYDPAAVRTVGSENYFPDASSAYLLAKGENGFRLERQTQVIVVTPVGANDTMTMQSFVSEDPNGWNMVFDFIEPAANGWLNGDSSLPAVFPASPDNGFISLYFTDEGDWVRTLDATILSVTSMSAVPLPAAMWLFGTAIVALVGFKRARGMVG